MQFGLITLTTEDLQLVSEEDLHFLIAASFIFNDMRFYCSLLARSPIDKKENEDIGALQYVRWLWASRKLAAVVCEAKDSIDKMIGSNNALKELSKTQQPIASENLKSPFMGAARKLRNKSTYHYGFEKPDLTEKLNGFSSHSNHRLFAHEQQGNSIFEWGEQIFTWPELTKAGHTGEGGQFDKWLMQTTSSIMKFCLARVSTILKESLPNRKFEWRELETKNEAKSQSERWPLFLETPK